MGPSTTQPPRHDTDKHGLRAELKAWERDFHKQHGHKPRPADVKAHPLVSKKYKQYHQLFRIKEAPHAASSSLIPQPPSPQRPTTTEFVSASIALKTVTPQKRNIAAFQYDGLTPTKPMHISDDASLESVGPTPQLNGRMLGIFHGIQDHSPIAKRRKLTWGEQLAEARKESPNKSTPRKRMLMSSPSSPPQVTPTKSNSSATRYSTPITHSVPLCNQHAFATPAFFRPTALPIQSPQSPSLLKMPSRVKGLSTLISDFRANQQAPLDEIEQDVWDDEEDLKIVQEHDSPGVAGRKPWTKKGAKRSKRRVIMRPVPALEIPASDDEARSPGAPIDEFHPISRVSPEIDQIKSIHSDSRNSASDFHVESVQSLETTTRKPIASARLNTNKGAAGSRKMKQVSGNFVSLKIRSKGRRHQGRFGGRRFGR